jgi:hypothetical protein
MLPLYWLIRAAGILRSNSRLSATYSCQIAMASACGHGQNAGNILMRLPRYAHQYIRGLGPYTSLLLLAVPVALIEPLKVAAVFIVGTGHWITGSITILCAYALGLLVVERIFKIVKPKLLSLRWFAFIWMRFVGLRAKVMLRVKGALRHNPHHSHPRRKPCRSA